MTKLPQNSVSVSHPIVALQMDPMETIKVRTDTTFALALEAQKRGYTLFHYTPENLSYQEGRLLVRGQFLTLFDREVNFYETSDFQGLDLCQAKYVLMRQDPPFDMAYSAATHLLDLLPPSTMVLNNPTGVRNAPEKLLPTLFPDLMPPTLMTRDAKLIASFLEQHQSIILKPLFDFGGNGIFKIDQGDTNLSALIELYQKLYKEPFIVQKFLPEIADGDKRILLIHGEPAGIFKRIPPEGQTRSNMRLGGQPVPCDFTQRDLDICTALKPVLQSRGLYLAGIDIIGNFLTEINVTSPTGLPVMNRLYSLDLAKVFWDKAEDQQRPGV